MYNTHITYCDAEHICIYTKNDFITYRMTSMIIYY